MYANVLLCAFRRSFGDIYLVSELMSTDLARLARQENSQMSMAHIKYIMYQAMVALKFMHSANLGHRDIKPGNILINEDCALKIG
jgi:serine/threonine protein kinase